jgi:hypothetical protein
MESFQDMLKGMIINILLPYFNVLLKMAANLLNTNSTKISDLWIQL